MKRILLLSMVFSFVFALSAWAQRTVSGKITDENGEGLPGVNVVIKGTTTGVTTDLDGNYQISVPDDNTVLVFSSVGMLTQEVTVGARSVIDLPMSTDTKRLDEVIVVGYGTSTKAKSSIASVTVSSGTITNRPNASFVQTLAGQVAGLNITTSTGQPGANSTVQLRGVSSINGDTEPLFIIDGTPVNQDNFRSLNPNEIASVTILKDAGATAIYGNRGANGVIIIETKSGSFNSPLEVTYTYTRSYAELPEPKYGLMTSQEQLTLQKFLGVGQGATMTDGEIEEAGNYDWKKVFFGRAKTDNHNITISKGGDNSTAFVSMGYMNQEGILKNSSLKRMNLRSNVSGRSSDDKFNYGMNLSLNYSESGEPSSIGTGGVNQNLVLGAYNAVPYLDPSEFVLGTQYPAQFVLSPYFLLDKLATFTRAEDETKIVTSFNVSYEVINGLVAALRMGADYEQEIRTTTQSPTAWNSRFFAETGNNSAGYQDQNYLRDLTYNQVASLKYTRELSDHTVSLGAYTEYFKAHRSTFGYNADGLNSKTFHPGDGSGFVGDAATNDWWDDQARADLATAGLFSYFGTLDWDYNERFGANVTVRRDASSRFAASNRWGTFYAVSGRWNIHNEAFASGLPFDVLKLRASYGTNGNQDITGLGTFSSLDLTQDFFSTAAGYGGVPAIGLSQIGNNTLKWETVSTLNVGLDAELFTSKLRANIDVYSRTTSELFLSVPVSAVNGTTSLNGNVGEMRNSGLDFTLNYEVFRDALGGDLDVKLFVVGNYNKNEILSFPGGLTQIIGTGRVGGSLGEYYDVRYAGVNPSNGNYLFLDGDGNLTENLNPGEDRVWLGKNIYPEWNGGFGLDASFKGFFLFANFTYIAGVDRYDGDLNGYTDINDVQQFHLSRDVLNSWTPENADANYPAYNAFNFTQRDDSNFNLFSADYIRLRTLQFGYVVPTNIVERASLRSAKVFFTGENLFTLTKWRGFDAEARNNGSREYPTPKMVSFGVEIGI